LKLALEALESDYAFEWPAMRRPERSEKKRLDALTAIKEALAQPAQEFVAYVTGMSFGRFIVEPLNPAMVLPIGMALYFSPQGKKT
jgi:hypothetical protein